MESPPRSTHPGTFDAGPATTPANTGGSGSMVDAEQGLGGTRVWGPWRRPGERREGAGKCDQVPYAFQGVFIMWF